MAETPSALGEYGRSIGRTSVPVSARAYLVDRIGFSLIIDARVFHGASSNAGEIGHIIVNIDGPVCSCGRVAASRSA